MLVTCDAANLGSATVTERCGVVFESLVDGEDGVPKRCYWVGWRAFDASDGFSVSAW